MNKKLILLFGSALVLTMTGCNAFQNTIKSEATLPTDREDITTAASQDPYRSQTLERGEIIGDWAIETVAGVKAKGETAPYLRFDSKTGKLYGNNGCNTVNANYSIVPGTKQLRFSDIITTMRACAEEDISEMQINLALDATSSYTWTREGSQYRVTLLNAEGKQLMTLLHQDFDFLNGTWRVVRIGDSSVNNDDMKLVFDIEEMRVHGNTGCNIMNGTLVTDMLEPDAISFQNMATTRRMCPDIQLETEMLVALESAVSVKPINASTVEFLDNQGQSILRLVRTTDD